MAAGGVPPSVDLHTTCTALYSTARTLREALELAQAQHPGVQELYRQLSCNCDTMQAAVHHSSAGSRGGGTAAVGDDDVEDDDDDDDDDDVGGSIQQFTHTLRTCRRQVWEWLLLTKSSQVFHRLDIPALLATATSSLNQCMEELSMKVVSDDRRSLPAAGLPHSVQKAAEALKGLKDLVEVAKPDRQVVRARAKAVMRVEDLNNCKGNATGFSNAVQSILQMVFGCNADYRAIIEVGAIPALMACLTNGNIWERGTVFRSITSLMSTKRVSPQLVETFKQAGLISFLVGVLTCKDDTDDAKENAVWVLRRFAISFETAKVDLVQLRLVPTLQNLLNDNESGDKLKAVVAWALWDTSSGLVASTDVASGLMAGAVIALVELLSSSSKDAQICAMQALVQRLHRTDLRMCTDFRHVSAGSEEDVLFTTREGMIPAFVAALQQQNPDDVKQQAVTSLTFLLGAIHGHVAAFLQAQGIPALVALLHENNAPGMHFKVIQLLKSLTHTVPQCRKLMVEAGAVPALVSGFWKCPSEQLGPLVWLLAALTADDVEGRQVLVDSDVLYDVVANMEATQEHSDNEGRATTAGTAIAAIPLMEMCAHRIDGLVRIIGTSRQASRVQGSKAADDGHSRSQAGRQRFLVALLTHLCCAYPSRKQDAIKAGAIPVLVTLFKSLKEELCAKDMPGLVAAIAKEIKAYRTVESKRHKYNNTDKCTTREYLNEGIALLLSLMTDDLEARAAAVVAGAVPMLIASFKDGVAALHLVARTLVLLSLGDLASQEAIVQAGLVHDVAALCTRGREQAMKNPELAEGCATLKKMCAGMGCEECVT